MTTLGSNYSLCMATVFAIQVNWPLSGDLKQVIVGLLHQHFLSCFAQPGPDVILCERKGSKSSWFEEQCKPQRPWDIYNPQIY